MRIQLVSMCLLVSAAVVLAQSDRGTITGTVADPAGAVVANAPIQARNTETGAVFQGASSATGNYTLPQLPTGNYEISVSVAGLQEVRPAEHRGRSGPDSACGCCARSRRGDGIGNRNGADFAAQDRKRRVEPHG